MHSTHTESVSFLGWEVEHL